MKYSSACAVTSVLSGTELVKANTTGDTAPKPRVLSPYIDKIRNIPKLFCTAYITPDAPGQGGQEQKVAKYPLALVPQDMREVFVRWRDHVKEINPSIVLLGYQIVIEESTVPGPGHDILLARGRAANAFCKYPGGFTPTVTVNGLRWRIYDPRNPLWQAAFLDACRATLASYPYDGLYLDQCTVYEKAHILPSVKSDMRQALQDTLLELRKDFPDRLLVGNSSYSWAGLNGELNEGRFADIQAEMAPFARHVEPRLELYQSLLRNSHDEETVRKEMAAAHSLGAFYAAAPVNDYQHALWFEVFDEVIAAEKR